MFRPKWLLFLAGCIALAIVFVNLGLWQLDRLDQRHAQNARVTQARDSEPARAADIFRTDAAPAKRNLFRQIKAVGRYDAAHEYLVRGRTVNDRAGLFVLTPLVTVDGPTLLVVRGFVPSSSAGAQVAPAVPAPESGEVTVVARVRSPESGGTQETRIGEYRSVKRINTERLARDLDGTTYVGYAELVDAPAGLVAIPEPPVEEGPHLAYAVQWFLFAGMLFIGYGVFARREEERLRS
jgi:cytochrome oxidase assembly protein ShyY1